MSIIVMTGGTSGFGKIALNMLACSGARVLLGARGKRAEGVETLPLDLSKMESVHTFANAVLQRIGNEEIDVLVFNAGIQVPGGTKTQDGFETSFAVNHLAHYLLFRLLAHKLTQNARIVLTTSGTYDPAEKTIIPPPRHANAMFLAYPEKDPDYDMDPVVAGGRAYSSSKLCVILTAKALLESEIVKQNNWSVIAYDPGATPGTGLTRGRNGVIKAVWFALGLPFIRPLVPGMNSQKKSGEFLADLASGKIALPEEHFYAAHRRGKLIYPELSELAMRDDLADALWKDSAALVGMQEP